MLRLSTVAPEGTGWARAARAFARDVEARSRGEVRVKWYLGGIVGDELQVLERIRRDQLDGIASGGALCYKLAPTMRVTRVVGLVQNRDEAAYLLSRLKVKTEAEFRKAGFTELGTAGIGSEMLLTRRPVRSLAELRTGRYWTWDLDDILGDQLTEIGIPVARLSLDQAAPAYDDGRIDGMLTVPTAALAWQWSAQARYLEELHLAFLSGCLIVADRAFDALTPQSQEAVRTAAAGFAAALEELGRQQDAALLGGLFRRQGLKTVPVSPAFRAEFFEAARAARDRLGEKLVPQALLLQVSSWLADYRAEHRGGDAR